MKLIPKHTFWRIQAGIALVTSTLIGVAEQSAVERVLVKDHALVMVKAGVTLPVTNQIVLPHEITVMTNGTFRFQNGKERTLLEGQVLGSDGMLTSPDGSLKPVFDHIAFLKGQPVIVKDGEASPLSTEMDLPDGQRITADGYLVSKGVRRKLLDGETFALTGKAVPASDTITLKEGKMIVQKDGSSMEIPAGRSLMMNDGTKVFGDGTIVSKDGTQTKLLPGQILKVEGVASKK